MNTKFQALPPLKRFRLMQQRLEQEQEQGDARLPAKKRKESREPGVAAVPEKPAPATGPTTYCLPAKKRVWAFQPDLCPDEICSPLDLNVEYKPSIEEEKVTSIPTPSSPVNGTTTTQCIEEKNEGQFVSDDDEEEDDGILCAICQSTDGDPSDPIVFCDGCDLMVHCSCYGNPLIQGVPDGDWFCTTCSEKSTNAISCCLCPGEGGAMKPTNDGRWAHVVCALFVPEVFFEDPEGREAIDCSMVPKKRWSDRCYVCKKRSGCAIDCSEPKCPLAFHVTCGLKEDLCIEYREGRKRGAVVAGFCKDHTELWKKQQQTGKFKIVARDD